MTTLSKNKPKLELVRTIKVPLVLDDLEDCFLLTEVSILVDNIQAGTLSREEATYVAVCMDYAAQMGARKVIGERGWKCLKTSVKKKD